MNGETALPRFPEAAFGWRGFAALLGLYILIHYALRVALSPTIGVDDVAESVFAQSLQWSYYHRQPPLYAWLLWGTFRLFGVSVAALFLLKYALIALGYVFFYLSAREFLTDRRLVFAAALSPSLIYAIGYGAHIGFTNTVLLTASCAATFYVFLLLVRRGALTDYFFLGATLAVGLLSKWGYPAFAGALIVAGLLQQPARRRLLNPRIALTLALAAALIVPFLVWGFHRAERMDDLFRDAMRQGGGEAYWPGVLSGFETLLLAIVGFLAPFWAFAAAIFPRAVVAPHHKPEPGTLDVRRLLEHFFIVMGAIVLIGVLAAGVTQYKSRWMHPVLILFPLYFFCRVQDAGFTARQLRRWAIILGLTAFVVLGVRLVQDGVGSSYCGKCRLQKPYPELAEMIGKDGFDGGTIVTQDEHIAGNFRMVFPNARIAAYPYRSYVPPLSPGAAGQCLAVWDAGAGDAMPIELSTFLKTGFETTVPDSAPVQSVTAPYRRGVTQPPPPGVIERVSRPMMLSLHYVLLSGAGRCR